MLDEQFKTVREVQILFVILYMHYTILCISMRLYRFAKY